MKKAASMEIARAPGTTCWLVILSLSQAILAAACGDSAAGVRDAGHDAGHDGGSEGGACAEPIEVAGMDDVLPLLPDADDWVFSGPYGWGTLPAITPDLRVHKDILLDAREIAGPDWCTRSDCRSEVRFSLGGAPEGVTVEGDVDDDYCGQGDRPLLRAEAGVVFRLRPLILDCHPSGYNWIPVLRVLPPCTQECHETTRRCPEDMVCYQAGTSYCLSCETRPAADCACVDIPEGDACSYFESGDMMAMGHCSDGTCVPD